MWLDTISKKCKDKCNRQRQYYDFKTGQCISCTNMSYPDQIIQKCVKCSPNCDDCGFKINTTSSLVGSEECLRCSSGAFIEIPKTKCRTPCNMSSYFDYNNMTCINCPSNMYLNRSL